MLSFLIISGLYSLYGGHISSGSFACNFCVFVHLKKKRGKGGPSTCCLTYIAFRCWLFFLYGVIGHEIRAVFVLGTWLILVFVSSFRYTRLQLLK